MGLRETAKGHNKFILEHTLGFSWPITLKNPAGEEAGLRGFSNDVAEAIDPETGQLVSGRIASVAVHFESIAAANPLITEYPIGIHSALLKPWLVTFDDIHGVTATFKVSRSNPDRALGIITLVLENYNG
jgi:hypothetical protein